MVQSWSTKRPTTAAHPQLGGTGVGRWIPGSKYNTFDKTTHNQQPYNHRLVCPVVWRNRWNTQPRARFSAPRISSALLRHRSGKRWFCCRSCAANRKKLPATGNAWRPTPTLTRNTAPLQSLHSPHRPAAQPGRTAYQSGPLHIGALNILLAAWGE